MGDMVLPLTRGAPAPMAVLMVVAGLAGGVVATVGDWRVATVAAIALALAVVVGRAEPVPTTQPSAVPAWVHTALPVVWVATAMLPTLRIVSALRGRARRGVAAAAGGSASVDVLFELAVYGAVLLGVLWLLRGSPTIRVTPMVLLAVVPCLLAVLSTTWSRLPIFTFGRAIQFLALGALVAVTTWAVRAVPDRGPPLLRGVTRGYVAVLVPLIAWMYASPRHWDGRLEWPGGHPNTSGAVVGVGVVLLAMRPRDTLVRAVPVPNWVLALALLVVELQIESRSSAVATVVALVAMAACHGLRDARWGAVVAAAGAIGGTLVMLFAWDEVLDFLLRDQSVGRVLGANGRRELWNEILRDPLGNEVWGLGMGAARDLIPAAWAGDAHSAYIDLLLSVGVIGLGATVGLALAVLVKGLAWDRPAAVGLVLYAVVLGMTATAFHEPGVELSALLLAVPVLYVADLGTGSPGSTGSAEEHQAPSRVAIAGPTRSTRPASSSTTSS